MPEEKENTEPKGCFFLPSRLFCIFGFHDYVWGKKYQERFFRTAWSGEVMLDEKNQQDGTCRVCGLIKTKDL